MSLPLIHMWWHDPSTAPDEPWSNLGHKVNYLIGMDSLPPIVTELSNRTNSYLDQPNQLRNISNILRWYLLSKHGGIWADCDVAPVRPFDIDTTRPFCASFAANTHIPDIYVIGGPQSHPIWDMSYDPTGKTSTQVSGAYRFYLHSHKYRNSLTVYHPGAFSEVTPAGKQISLPEGIIRYATHQWHTASII